MQDFNDKFNLTPPLACGRISWEGARGHDSSYERCEPVDELLASLTDELPEAYAVPAELLRTLAADGCEAHELIALAQVMLVELDAGWVTVELWPYTEEVDTRPPARRPVRVPEIYVSWEAHHLRVKGGPRGRHHRIVRELPSHMGLSAYDVWALLNRVEYLNPTADLHKVRFLARGQDGRSRHVVVVTLRR